MLQFNINLTSLAIILWSGMLVIAGSVWVLSSQVRKVADLIEQHSDRAASEARSVPSPRTGASVRVARAARARADRRDSRSAATNRGA